ncbi:MAG: hypothetical protein ACREJM_14600, partial [Candidatus Saccharimonadales bacterium]
MPDTDKPTLFRLNPRTLLLIFLLTVYADLFVMSIGLFIIYPDDQHPTALALIPPIIFLPVIGAILFRLLPALKDRRRKLYRVTILLPSLSLIT